MDNQIYALVDRSLMEEYGLDFGTIGSFLERQEIGIVQYRDKEADDEAYAQRLTEFRRRYGGTIIVNDRLNLAPLADGLHLGQEDLAALDPDPAHAVAEAREIIDDRLLGLSTHNAEEIETANILDLDYIGLGAYRPTATKADAAVSGEGLLRLARRSRHPVALIGGVLWEDEFPVDTIRWKVLGRALFERMSAR
ncbi:thiamine phosphate synthase [Nitratifractor sp.]